MGGLGARDCPHRSCARNREILTPAQSDQKLGASGLLGMNDIPARGLGPQKQLWLWLCAPGVWGLAGRHGTALGGALTPKEQVPSKVLYLPLVIPVDPRMLLCAAPWGGALSV